MLDRRRKKGNGSFFGGWSVSSFAASLDGSNSLSFYFLPFSIAPFSVGPFCRLVSCTINRWFRHCANWQWKKENLEMSQLSFPCAVSRMKCVPIMRYVRLWFIFHSSMSSSSSNIYLVVMVPVFRVENFTREMLDCTKMLDSEKKILDDQRKIRSTHSISSFAALILLVFFLFLMVGPMVLRHSLHFLERMDFFLYFVLLRFVLIPRHVDNFMCMYINTCWSTALGPRKGLFNGKTGYGRTSGQIGPGKLYRFGRNQSRGTKSISMGEKGSWPASLKNNLLEEQNACHVFCKH